jgi:peroxiredoxin Q/BCP
MNCPHFTLPLVELKKDVTELTTSSSTSTKIKVADYCTTTNFDSYANINNHQLWVLYFYPRDNTSGCTQETQDFSDLFPQFQANNVSIYGISRDTIGSHQKFAHKLVLPFGLLADPDETVCNLFNVMKQKKMYGKDVRGICRSTFLFRGKTCLKEWRDVKATGHAQEVLDFIKS